jgi:hypothetical protein
LAETTRDAKTLTRQAFEQARLSGRQEWQMMTTAVLKNRMLQLTSREFTEAAYGANSVLDLVRLIPETVELEEACYRHSRALATVGASEPSLH